MELGMDLATARRILDVINSTIQNHFDNKDALLTSIASDFGTVWQSPSADQFQLALQTQIARLPPKLSELRQLRDQLASAIREWEEIDRKFGT